MRSVDRYKCEAVSGPVQISRGQWTCFFESRSGRRCWVAEGVVRKEELPCKYQEVSGPDFSSLGRDVVVGYQEESCVW